MGKTCEQYMKKPGDTAGVTSEESGLIPGSFFTSRSIPTSYATFSTGCPFWTARTTLHLGFTIELSRYQQP